MGRLDVRICEARNLPDTQLISKPDPYVVVKLEHQTHKTSVKDNQVNPKWEEVFKFTVADENSSQIKFELWNHNIISDEFLGQYTLSLSGLERGVVRDQWYLLQQCKSNAELRIRLLATDFGAIPANAPQGPQSVAGGPSTLPSQGPAGAASAPPLQPQGAPSYPPQAPPQQAPPPQQQYPPQGAPSYPPPPPQGAPGSYPPAQYPPAQYPPPQGGYPPQGGAPSYPPQAAPQYPPPQGGYPPQPGYPPQQPGYPPQGAPSYPPQPGYPPQQPGYPPQQAQGYPPQGPNYGY